MKRLVVIILTIVSIIVTAGTFTSPNYPLTDSNPMYQQYPELRWGAVFQKNVVTKLINNKTVLVNALKIQSVTASPGAGPFTDVSGTYAANIFGSGRADIVSITYGGKIVIKRNDGLNQSGNLTFTDVYSYKLPAPPGQSRMAGDGTLVVDDFDKDGKLDIFVFNSWGYGVYISNGVTRNVPSSEIRYSNIITAMRNRGYNDFVTMWTLSAMATYDYNNDRYKDIIYADMRGRVWAWKFDPTRKDFLNANQIELLFQDNDIGTTAGNGGGVLDLGDLNGDGVPDIIAGNTDKTGIFIYPGKIVNNKLTFNKNDRITLITASTRTSSASINPTYLKVDSSIPNSKNPMSLPSFAPTVIKITDVDRDGKQDIFIGTDAWRQGQNFGGSVYLFKGTDYTPDGKPVFTSLELVRGSYESAHRPPYDFDAGTIADLDGDGIPDFVAADGNHSGNFYRILTKTVNEYITDPGYMISDVMWKVVSIPISELQRNFIKKITVELKFSQANTGTFELRYTEQPIKNPHLANFANYPFFPGISGPVNVTVGNLRYTVEFAKPIPEPQVILVLRPKDKNTAPNLEALKYTVETMPSVVTIKNFKWTGEK